MKNSGRLLPAKPNIKRKMCIRDRLCALAQKGDAVALDSLIENNKSFIGKVANDLFRSMNPVSYTHLRIYCSPPTIWIAAL